MDSYMSKALLGVFRIAIIEHVRFPFLIRRFYDLGPGLASARLAELLLEAQRRGDLREGDCAMAADHFVAMIRGNVHLQVVLRLRAPPLANERRALVDSAVARSEEHTSELQSLMRISYAVFCLKKKKKQQCIKIGLA